MDYARERDNTLVKKEDLEAIYKDDENSDALLTKYAIMFMKNPSLDNKLLSVMKRYNISPFDINMVKELLWTKYVADCVYQQYFQYGFADKTKEERHEYIGSYEIIDWQKSICDFDIKAKLDDKFEAYKLFSKYYKREAIKVAGFDDFEKFVKFINKHKKLIVKPIVSYGGCGIKIIDSSEKDFSAKKSFLELITIGGAVCEQIIEQVDDMAKFHPNSVNTIRVVTYYNKEKDDFRIMYAFIRIGVGDNVVDNTSAGGLAAAVDENGVIISKAINRNDLEESFHSVHPDTNVQIQGESIPKWDELVELVKDLVNVVPQQKYIGWDLALSKDGWIMVEGNISPLISTIQILEEKGIRYKYKDIM